MCLWQILTHGNLEPVQGKKGSSSRNSNRHATMTEEELIAKTLPRFQLCRSKAGARFLSDEAMLTSPEAAREMCAKEVRTNLSKNPPTRPFFTVQRTKATAGSHCVNRYGMAPRSREWQESYGTHRVDKILQRQHAQLTSDSSESPDSSSGYDSSSESSNSSSGSLSDDDRGEDGMYGVSENFVKNFFALRMRRRKVSAKAWWGTPEGLLVATQGPQDDDDSGRSSGDGKKRSPPSGDSKSQPKKKRKRRR